MQSYNYDQGRLSFADTFTGTYAYNYDKVGNRTDKIHEDKNGNTSTENYTYPEDGNGNRLSSLSLEGEGETSQTAIYQYNKNGSPKQTKDFSYEYNANQRPIKVFKQTQDNSTTYNNNKELLAEYRYNSFGERIKKVSYSQGKKAKVTYFLYDGHTLTAEIEKPVKSGGVSFDSAQEPTFNQYIYLNHQPIAKLEQKQLYAIHSDHLGTPRLVTNDKKETVWKANYSPFGKATVETHKITFNLRLPGQYEDQETGTYYNYLRDYDPETGRYITSDPIGLKGGVNTYAYVKGSPIKYTDPLGLLIPYEAAILPVSPDAVKLPLGGIQYLPVVWDLLPHQGVSAMPPVPTDLGTVAGYQIVPYVFTEPGTGKPTSVAWYGAYDPILKETIFAISPDNLQDFIQGANVWRDQASSLINTSDYELSSSTYVYQILKGDFKGGLGTLACSWGDAFKSPEWWFQAAAGTSLGRAGLAITGGVRKVFATFTQKQLDKKFKHAIYFGMDITKKNPATLSQFKDKLIAHLHNSSTIQKGTYGYVQDSKVFFNNQTNNAVVLDKFGEFVTAVKLIPGTPQYIKYIKDGFLK